jgi:hypothetical protein
MLRFIFPEEKTGYGSICVGGLNCGVDAGLGRPLWIVLSGNSTVWLLVLMSVPGVVPGADDVLRDDTDGDGVAIVLC